MPLNAEASAWTPVATASKAAITVDPIPGVSEVGVSCATPSEAIIARSKRMNGMDRHVTFDTSMKLSESAASSCTMKTSNSVVVTEMFHDEKMHVAKSNEHSSFGAFVKKVQSLEPDQPNAKRLEMSASSQPAATSLSDSRQMTIAQQSMSIEDFSYQRDIGAGSFGRVILVVHKNSRRVLAMKTISKKVLRRKKIAQEEWRLERDVLVKIEAHPYIVELLCSFQTASHFFLVMAYLPRGELFTFLRRRGTFPEDVAAFYSAEVTLAIEHLRLISVENFQVSHRKRTQARVQGNPSGLEA
tara:strand:- start:1091 stop:1990 length:900 start_codon:yes stop_codon:yes gene_type:complete